MTSFQYGIFWPGGVTLTRASPVGARRLERNNPRSRSKRQTYFSVAELLQNGFTLFRLTGGGGVGLVVRLEAGGKWFSLQ